MNSNEINSNEIDETQLHQLLETLRVVPARNPHAAERGRSAFLGQAHLYRASVSPSPKRRLNGWKTIFIQKEPFKMTALASILLIVSLLFGGAGATVYAAQYSAPDQALYSVKMWSENARLDLASGPQAQLELALEYANRRAQEAVNQFQAGAIPSTAVQQRWQDQLSLAMKVAAGMPDKDMRPALQQIQASVQDQLRDMDRLHLTGDPDQIRQRLQIMLQDCLNKINLGQQQPAQFREQSRQGWKNFAPTAQPSQSAGGGNPWTTGTPTPGSSYGSGNGSNPWTTGTPTPGSGYGPGSSQNPWTTGTPVPGSSYGPGPGTGATCTPGSGPGPNPAQPQVQPTSGKNPGNGGQPTSLPSSGGPRKP